MGIADDCEEIFGSSLHPTNSKVNMKMGKGIEADVAQIWGSASPQVTELSSSTIEL